MASALEKDLDPNTYIGLSFPLRKDNNTDFAMTRNSLQQAKHNLKNLLLTFPGERVGQPEFGSRMREICFEPIDDELPNKIEEDEPFQVGYLISIYKKLILLLMMVMKIKFL